MFLSKEPRGTKILHQFPLHNISYCADEKGVKKFFRLVKLSYFQSIQLIKYNVILMFIYIYFLWKQLHS